MIRGAELRNWRSHSHSRLTFEKGTNILVGIMGSGKSSVVDGICFALFGTFPALQQRKVKLQELVRRGEERGGAKVSVIFDVGGEEYEAIRTINEKGGGEGELRNKGRLIEGPQSKRVTEKIEELLGVDYELFARAVYSEQNGIDYFLELGRGQRKKQIDELMGIDRFEDARTEASRVINRLREMARDRRGAVGEEEEKRAKGELEKAVGEIGKLETETTGIESDVLRAKVRKENVEKEFRLIEKKKSELEILERKRASFEGIVEKLRSLGIGVARAKPEIAGEIGIMKKEAAKAGEEASANRDSISKVEGELGKCRSKLEDVKNRAEKRKKLLGEIGGRNAGEIERKLSETKNEIEKMRNEVSKNNAELENLRNSLSELESAGAECPVCESRLDDARKRELREKRKGKVEEIEKGMGELKTRLAESGILAKEGERELQTLRDANSKLSALEVKEGEENRLGEEIAKLEDERKKLFGERELTEKKKMSLDEELRKFERELEGAEAREGLEGVAKSIALLEFDKTGYEMARGELEKAQVDEGRLAEKLNGLRREMKRVEEVRKLQEEKLKRIETERSEAKRLEESAEQMSIFQNCLVSTQKELREELIEAINGAMNEVWGVLYPYGDYKGVRLRAGEADYELEALVDGEWRPVEGIASGGERACACLALRIAFAMVLAPNLNWLVLDEPTHNLDEEAVRTLAEALYEKIPKIIGQIFVITHDENLKDAASGSLYRISRDKEKGEASAVEKIS